MRACPGACGLQVVDNILCCDPCWERIPTRVPGFDRPWRSARRWARSTNDWLRFERATDAARNWLLAHPVRSVPTGQEASE